MTGMVATHELAARLGVTRGRVSQMVAEGKLEGCYTGTGRARKFDLAKVAAVLPQKLDPGQMMGNGAGTKRALAALREDVDAPVPTPAPPPRQRESGELSPNDPDRYELARTQKAEEEARRLRRQNAEAEGQYVLASEVQLQVARQIGQEIAEVETVLRDGARRVADKLGVDFKAVRALLIETWRAHRGARVEHLRERADAARLSDAERDQDI